MLNSTYASLSLPSPPSLPHRRRQFAHLNMKFAPLLLACLAAAADTRDGFLWTIDHAVASGSSSASIDTHSASAIIARRRGLTSSRQLGSVNAVNLQELEYYGGWQQPLLAGSDITGPGKLFIRILGYDGGFEGLASAPVPDLWIESPTSALKTDFSARDRQAEAICEYVVPPSRNQPNSKGVEVVFSYPAEKDIGCLAASEIPTIPLVLTLYSVLPESGAGVPDSIQSLIRILKHLSATQGLESTLLLLPSKLVAEKAQKRSTETPLDLHLEPTLSPVEYSSPVYGQASNLTLPDVVPQCFASKAACTNTTNACSGHGQCYAASASCFKCRCSATVERVYDDGSKKTVQWGGNACEKKDVSVPFIIFASFGLVFTALVVGGIGLLFSIGSEALPSVLSAAPLSSSTFTMAEKSKLLTFEGNAPTVARFAAFADYVVEYQGVQAAYFEWADSYDSKDWTRLSKILAPSLRIDYRSFLNKLWPAMPAAEFIAMISSKQVLGDKTLKTQHFLGASKYEKVADDEIIGWHQLYVPHQRYTDETLSKVAVQGHAHSTNQHWYKKVDGVWKFAGLDPDIRWFEHDFDKVFAEGRENLGDNEAKEDAERASGVPPTEEAAPK
ncbi:hypothetical protein DV738_g194, partial [Chaetothyriales sp. CBS 135597]